MSVVERFGFKCNLHPDTVAERVYYPKCNRYKWKCCGRQCREHPRGDAHATAAPAVARDDASAPTPPQAFKDLMTNQYTQMEHALTAASTALEKAENVESCAKTLKGLSKKARSVAQATRVAERLLAAAARDTAERRGSWQVLQEKAEEVELLAAEVYSCRNVPIYEGRPFAGRAYTWYRIWVKYPDGVQTAAAVTDVLSMFDEYQRGDTGAIEVYARASGVTGRKQLQCFATWINQNLCRIAVEPSSTAEFQVPEEDALPEGDDGKPMPIILVNNSALQEITPEAFQRIIDNIDLEAEQLVEKLTGALSVISLASQMATLSSFACKRSTEAQLLVLACMFMFMASVCSVLPRVTSVWRHKFLLKVYCAANAVSFALYFFALYECNGPVRTQFDDCLTRV